MTLQGADGLQRRLEAIRSSQGQRAMMQMLGRAVASEAIHRAPRKTANLQRSIKVEAVSDTHVTIEAQAAYAGFVERGTRPHIIRPRNAKALRFAATAAGQRLSGSARRGAAVIFARIVHHPGTRPQPYMWPAARDVIRDSGLVTGSIIERWNKAD
jgi:HK97 gp10 family phage protein